MSRLTLRLLPFIVILVAVSSGPYLEAQSGQTGTVGGQVSIVGGSMAGAKISVTTSGDATYTATATTDANGKFSIQGVPLGTVTINVSDTQNNLLKTLNATLASAGQVLNLDIQVP